MPSLSPVSRNIGDLGDLLDAAERLVESSPLQSLKVQTTLDIMHNARQNFEATSPLTVGSTGSI
jgi:hypothetical protein